MKKLLLLLFATLSLHAATVGVFKIRDTGSTKDYVTEDLKFGTGRTVSFLAGATVDFTGATVVGLGTGDSPTFTAVTATESVTARDIQVTRAITGVGVNIGSQFTYQGALSGTTSYPIGVYSLLSLIGTTPVSSGEHGVALYGQAQDSFQNDHALIGVQGKVSATGTADAYTGIASVATYTGPPGGAFGTFAGQALYGIAVTQQSITNSAGTADDTAGTNYGAYIPPLIGGLNKYGLTVFNEIRALAGAQIGAWGPSSAQRAYFYHNDTDAAFVSTLGHIYLVPQSGVVSVTGALAASTLVGTGLTSGRLALVSTSGTIADLSSITYSAGVITATGFTGALNGTVGATSPTSGVFTGVISADYKVTGVTGANRGYYFQTNSVDRWFLKMNGTAEGGSDAGSNLALARYSDAGAFISDVFVITRSSGAIEFYAGITGTTGTFSGAVSGAAGSFTTLGASSTLTASTTIELGHATQNTLSASGGVLSVEGVAVPTISSTNSLTNKTIDASATGNVVKLKGYIYLSHPHMVDGTGATLNTTTTAITYGHATFSNSADKAGNYAEYYIQVPEDIDTSVALRGRLKFVLGGADTAAQNWLVSSVSVADSAVPTSSTLANETGLTYSADGSGASGDVETTAWTTLTSWAGALTAGQTWRIRLARDGDTSDASTVNSTELGLVIEYGITQ